MNEFYVDCWCDWGCVDVVDFGVDVDYVVVVCECVGFYDFYVVFYW